MMMVMKMMTMTTIIIITTIIMVMRTVTIYIKVRKPINDGKQNQNPLLIHIYTFNNVHVCCLC